MKLSEIEFRAMQTQWRRWGQRNVELPLFRRMGLDAYNKDLLEIGCGSGYGGYLLNQLNPSSYVGLDVMDEQIALAKHQFPQYNFKAQDATNLSQFPNDSLDIIVIFGVLHHIPEWKETLNEIFRVLRSNGELYLEEPRIIDVKLFDFFFKWGHPDSDFGLKALDAHLKSINLTIINKRWTPLLTMYSIQKTSTSQKTI